MDKSISATITGICSFLFLYIRNETKNRRKNWIRKKPNTFKPWGLNVLALSKRNRTISEKLLDKPVLEHGSPVNISQADFIGWLFFSAEKMPE